MFEDQPPPAVFVGIDWASHDHAVCVLDQSGRQLAAFTIEHTADGIAALVRRLAKYTPDPGDAPIAIERPNGRLVDLLLEAGHPVIPVSPNAIKTWREGEVLSGAKSDAADARVIAEYLRLRLHRLAPVAPYSPQTKALRIAVRTRDDVVSLRVRVGNQLRALLDTCWPGAATVFADLSSPIALAFLLAYPTPNSAARVGVKRIEGFLARNGYSGKRPAQEVLARLRSAPPGTTDPIISETLRESVVALVGILQAVNTAEKSLRGDIARQMQVHPDGAIFTSLPRSGQINAAQMLAEWGDARQAYDSPDAVAALAGLSPVTNASGKHRAVHFRWACNKRFRVAMTTFADNSRHSSDWAADVYARARARGHDHPHAVRVLARAWTRVIYRCWQTRTPYDPTLHGAARIMQSAA
ncbi:IS110 family transposase [Tsukamurella spumae]|uniref:IS110 family transposase n=2 Tax=Tsukamurella spumae TaxID=44753 RepID=A0A846X6A6_9ACTN|nr:IS110 family transposase [Tsukamurella spumae]NKY21038.1 IS110 family transposase [Tsukamurella spumae]